MKREQMSQEATTKSLSRCFFLQHLAHAKTDFLASRFPQFTKTMEKSQILLQQKRVTSHCVHHACFHVCLPNAPDLFVKCSSSHLYFLPGFLSGFTSRCCSSHLDSPGRFPAFQFQGFIWVHQFHLSSRLCVVDFQPTRVFRVLGSGFTSRCCHPATSPLWAMGSGG